MRRNNKYSQNSSTRTALKVTSSVYDPLSEYAQTRSQVTCIFSINPIRTAILILTRPEDTSYQPSISSTMSQILAATTSTSNYQSIFDNAIEAYRKKTKKDLRSHPLLDKLQNCDSPDAVLRLLYEQIPGFDQSHGADDKLAKWLNPTINVLYTFSGVIGGSIGLASPQKLRVHVVLD